MSLTIKALATILAIGVFQLYANPLPIEMNVTIYDEDVEWAFESSATSFNPSDTSNPHTGKIDFYAFHALPGDSGSWVSPNQIGSSTISSLTFWVDPVTWALAANISFFWLDNHFAQVGNAVALQNGKYGFVNTSNVYQQITIPMSDFGVGNTSIIQALAIVAEPKTFMTFYLDTMSIVVLDVVTSSPPYPRGDGGFEAFVTVPTPASYNGMSGWWNVPQQWYCQTDPAGQIWVSPNPFPDPTCTVKPNPCYAARVNIIGDGAMIFQDVMRNHLTGNLNPYFRRRR